MKIILYTAITNNYEKPRNDILVFGQYDKFINPARNYLIYKTLGHKFLDCDVSIWIDGNLSLLISPEQLVEEWLRDADMATWKHPFRDCIYEECEANIQRIESNKIGIEEIQQLLKHYNDIGFPKHNGRLLESSVLIRRHNEITKRFNEYWWAEICRWSYRDQLTFPLALKQFPELKINFIEGNMRNHPYFKYIPHLHN